MPCWSVVDFFNASCTKAKLCYLCAAACQDWISWTKCTDLSEFDGNCRNSVSRFLTICVWGKNTERLYHMCALLVPFTSFRLLKRLLMCIFYICCRRLRIGPFVTACGVKVFSYSSSHQLVTGWMFSFCYFLRVFLSE